MAGNGPVRGVFWWEKKQNLLLVMPDIRQRPKDRLQSFGPEQPEMRSHGSLREGRPASGLGRDPSSRRGSRRLARTAPQDGRPECPAPGGGDEASVTAQTRQRIGRGRLDFCSFCLWEEFLFSHLRVKKYEYLQKYKCYYIDLLLYTSLIF